MPEAAISCKGYQVREHSSGLGEWIHGHSRPPELAGLVDEIWYFEGVLVHPRERILADGCYELIVHLGPVYSRVMDGHAAAAFPECCMTGLRLGPELIEAPPGRVAVLGIRLTPRGAHALLRRPLHDLVGLTVALDEVLSAGSRALVDRCAAAPTPETRLAVAAAWLRERMCRPADWAPAIAWAATEIERAGGDMAIGRLRERTGWSKGRFASTFREQVGITPKVFARVHRFRRALQLLANEERRLSDVALSAGYYDQPHFNADFRAFTGQSPSEFLTARRYPTSGSLAEDSSISA